MRIWLTMAFHAVTSVAGNSRDGCPVLFMLDEMAQLGRMEQLIQAVSLLAGYHMTLWMIWQDLAQIKSLYPSEWTSFLANAKVQQFFGINDAETAKYLSEQLGKATVGVQTKTQGVSMERGFIAPKSASDSSGVSYSEKERPILSIDEVRRLERLAMIMLVQGCPPILAERITYYQDNFMSRCCARP
jgi:type IV secretion system protein VirD4